MPPKKKVDLPDHVREAVLDSVELAYEAVLDAKDLWVRADERVKIRIHMAIERGLTTRDIEERTSVPQQTISRWNREGREALERRGGGVREPAGDQHSGEDPFRSAEREPVG